MTVKIVYDEKNKWEFLKALSLFKEKKLVYVVNNNVVEKRDIQTGKEILEKFQFYQAFQLGKKLLQREYRKLEINQK